LGEFPASLSELAQAGLRWWEILLLSAVTYAQKTVLCVLPEGVRLPSSVLSRAKAQGKRIQCIPLSRFGIGEREKLAVNYLLKIPEYDDDEELNATEFKRFRVQSYAPIMKQFWAELRPARYRSRQR
jgi:hypothetical protein